MSFISGSLLAREVLVTPPPRLAPFESGDSERRHGAGKTRGMHGAELAGDDELVLKVFRALLVIAGVKRLHSRWSTRLCEKTGGSRANRLHGSGSRGRG